MNVLYGGPYYQKGHLVTTRGNELYFSDSKNLMERARDKTLQQLRERVQTAKQGGLLARSITLAKNAAARQLGCGAEDVPAVLKDLNELLLSYYDYVYEYSYKVLSNPKIQSKAVLEGIYAGVAGNPLPEHKVESFNEVMDFLQRQTTGKRGRPAKGSIREMVAGMRGRDNSKASYLSGNSDELALALTALASQEINSDRIHEAVRGAVSMPGSKGDKTDVVVGNITISAKNYKAAKNSFAKDTSKRMLDFKVQTTGNLVNFFQTLMDQVDRDLKLDADTLETLNSYWLNLLYFKGYTHSRESAMGDLNYLEKSISEILEQYAVVYLMTGNRGDREGSFLQKTNQRLTQDSSAAFFWMSGIGLVPSYSLLEQLHSAIKKNDNSSSFSLSSEVKSRKGEVDIFRKSDDNLVGGTKSMTGSGVQYWRSAAQGDGTPQRVIQSRHAAYYPATQARIYFRIRCNYLRSIVQRYV